MGYGYGTGFVKATSDIPLVNLRVTTGTMNPGSYFNFKIMGTDVNYNVPASKTGLIALVRVTSADMNRLFDIRLGYADDANGTNFIALASLGEMGISNPPSEVYWVLRIPGNKFVGIRHTGSATSASFTIFLVLFEV